MAKFQGNAERPGDHTPGAQYLEVRVDAADHPDGGERQGIATLVVSWGVRGATRNDEQGREEYTRLGETVESAIDAVRDAALSEQKGQSRRYVETATSRAMLEVVAERDFWRRASDVAQALVAEWLDKPPGTLDAMKEAVRAVVVTERQATAVMELVGHLLSQGSAGAATSAMENPS